jgi:DNA polymerase-3 subunit beta
VARVIDRFASLTPYHQDTPMNLYIDRDDLLKALNPAVALLGRGNDNPVLRCVLLTATPAALKLGAFTTEMHSAALVTANVSRTGSVAVDARALKSAVATLPEATVSIECKPGIMSIKSGRTSLKLQTHPGIDHPMSTLPATVPTERPTVLPAKLLSDAIKATRHAPAREAHRYGLNGLHIHRPDYLIDPAARLVGTDGHRLAWTDIPGVPDLYAPDKSLIPVAALPHILSWLDAQGEVCVAWTASTVVLSARDSDATLSIRLINGEFPDYAAVVPRPHERIHVGRLDLLSALKRLVSVVEGGATRINERDGGICISTKKEGNEFEEVVPAEVVAEGFQEFGINPLYLIDALAALSCETVAMHMPGPLAPMLIQDRAQRSGVSGSHGQIIVPMRLD